MRESHGAAYRKDDKLRGGPGGWGCSCCNPYNCNPRNMKSLARRLARRKRNMELRASLSHKNEES